MPFSAVRIVVSVVVAQQLSTSVTSLRYSSILGVAEFGRRLQSQAEVGGSPRLMRLPAVHGIIAPKKPWLVTDGSHVYVRKLKFCNLGAWLGTPGPWGTGLLGSLVPVSLEMLVYGSGSSGSSQMIPHVVDGCPVL